MKLGNHIKKINLKDCKGVTLADLTIAALMITVFTGLIATLMYKSYQVATETAQTATANSYATIILEKVDEKEFDTINNNFLTMLVNNNEIDFDTSNITFNCQYPDNASNYTINGECIFKEVTVTVNYENSKKITLKKLKIKEMGNM